MIQTKEDLRNYLKRDNKGWGTKSFIYRFVKHVGGSENYYTNEFFRVLRYYEYYLNCHRWDIRFLYWKLKYNHYRMKSNLYVGPNSIGPGIQIVHPGFLRIDSWVHIGENCTILPNVLFGKKKVGIDNKVEINVGNNCYISTGAIILGPIEIGNNVIIGAGAVVNKDIPDNVVVAGVPAKVIKSNLSN